MNAREPKTTNELREIIREESGIGNMSLHIHPDGYKSFRAVVYGGILNDVARAQVAVESVIEQLRLRYCLKD